MIRKAGKSVATGEPNGTEADRPTRLITLQEVEKRTTKSRWWIRTEVAAGRFPKPVTLGYRRTVFVEAEVEAWIQALLASREQEAA